MLAFRQVLEVKIPPRFTTFLWHPQRRLLEMVFRRELDMLIGASG